MAAIRASLVSDDDIRTYRADGAVALRGVFDADWVASLRDGVDTALAEPGPLAKCYTEEGAGRFTTDHAMFQRHEPFHRFVLESPAGRIAAELMGASRVNLYDEHMLVKEPGTVNPTYWHHDMPYFRIQGDMICSLWVALDSASVDTGALWFAKGSHRWGKRFRPVRIGVGDFVDGSDPFDGPVPDIDADPERYPTVCYEAEPGDCLAFHGLTLHSARGNASPNRIRRAVAYRFAGDDITWNPKNFTPTFFEPPELVDGGPIDCDLFPRVWTEGG